MTALLTLSTGANGPAAPQRIAPISGATPAQSRIRQTLAGLNQAYRALTMTQKGGWQTVANTLNRTQGRAGRHKLSPANAFVTLNSALLAIGSDILTDAPADLTAPGVIPPLTVQTSAPATAVNAAAFTLNLITQTDYNTTTHILAAPPAPVGKNTFPDNDFKTIGFHYQILSGVPADISALYAAAYGIPAPGSQIALKLIAVSPAGIRLTPLVLTGVVTPAATDATPGQNAPLHLR